MLTLNLKGHEFFLNQNFCVKEFPIISFNQLHIQIIGRLKYFKQRYIQAILFNFLPWGRMTRLKEGAWILLFLKQGCMLAPP